MGSPPWHTFCTRCPLDFCAYAFCLAAWTAAKHMHAFGLAFCMHAALPALWQCCLQGVDCSMVQKVLRCHEHQRAQAYATRSAQARNAGAARMEARHAWHMPYSYPGRQRATWRS